MGFQFIISCIYFFLPAYLGNMVPPLARKAGIFKFLAGPLDFGKMFLKEPFLGSHKTWRGTILYMITGVAVVYLQYFLYQYTGIRAISIIDYSQINLLLFGVLFSGGAVFGDVLFAFFKRRLKLQPGARFVPFDQINYVIGAFLFLHHSLKLIIRFGSRFSS
jgi:CDP-2,3-bis-(O-geranylgeranyl)-sn-glycerol synthase